MSLRRPLVAGSCPSPSHAEVDLMSTRTQTFPLPLPLRRIHPVEVLPISGWYGRLNKKRTSVHLSDSTQRSSRSLRHGLAVFQATYRYRGAMHTPSHLKSCVRVNWHPLHIQSTFATTYDEITINSPEATTNDMTPLSLTLVFHHTLCRLQVKQMNLLEQKKQDPCERSP